MKYIVSGAQAKEIDRYTIEEMGIPSMVLMERAALAVVENMKGFLRKDSRVLCLCGVGNNGGDGIAIARILHQRGYVVAYELVGDAKKASEDNKKQQAIAEKFGVDLVNNPSLSEYTIVVDSLFGIGISRDITGIYQEKIEQMQQFEGKVVSVDIPSGVHTDKGNILGCAVRADVTVTFGYAKPGLLLYPGAECAGRLVIADIGFAREYEASSRMFAYETEDLKQLLPARAKQGNKGTFGRVLVIAGCRNMAGACYLSAQAAYRMGAGLVKVLTPECNRSIIQQLLPEAVLQTYEEDCLDEAEICKAIQDAKAIVVGPGLGRGQSAERIVQMVLKHGKVPTVIDADALQILAKERKEIQAFDGERAIWSLGEQVIVTPHLKEMADMLGEKVCVKDLQQRIYDIQSICAQNKNVLVLKDARTLVVQGEKCYINLSGNDGMATAGSGDVLTGIILGLLAQGLEPYEAATLGVYIHGLAGDHAAKRMGTYSMTASDLIAAIPGVLKSAKEEEYERIS